MTGFRAHMNDLGDITNLSLLPALTLDTLTTNRGLDRIALAVFPLLFAADLILCGLVGKLAAAAVGMLIWLLAGRMMTRSILLIAAAGIMVLVFTDAQREERSFTALERFKQSASTDRDEASLWSRVATTRVAWEAIRTTQG